MAENPVLTEARRKGILSTGTTATKTGSSAVVQSGSANPVVREFNGTAASERAAAQQKIVEAARQQTAAQTQAAEVQPKTDGLISALLSRVKNTASGAAKSAASSYANVGGMAAEGAGKWNTRIANYNAADTLKSAQDAVARYQTMLDTGKWADGTAMTAADRKQVQAMLAASQRKLSAQKSYTDAVEASDKAVADKAYQTADRLSESGAQDIAAAKEGLGKVGQFAVDLGSQGVQMAGDIAASAVIPGSGLALMGARSAGSAAQEARQSGATYGQQLAYGLGSGAVSIATEKLSSVAAPFKKAFGGGVLDDAISKATAKLGGNAAGKAVLSMLSEGGEEMVEDLVQPILQRMTYDRDALGQYGDTDYWAQMLYDGLVGAAMGGLGSGVEAVQNRISGRNAAGKAAAAQTEMQEGNVTAQPQGIAQAAQTAPQAAQSNIDPLLEILTNGKRVNQATLSAEQFDALADRGDIGIDANGDVYQINPDQHIDQRDSADIASRKVRAFQFDNPQLQQYYKSAAETLLVELEGAQPGGQTLSAMGEYGPYSWWSKRSASPRIEALLDGGMSYARIDSALDAIIHDKGQENYADAKRVEMVLDTMLTNGYNDGTQFVPANEAYINTKDQIAGSNSAERGNGLDGIGAANAGSLNSDYDNLQAQSERFHPEGANAARPVDVPTTNFEGRNIPKSASTIMGAQALDGADVQFLEQQIANGTLAFDTIKDTDAVSYAQTVMSGKGFDGALEQYRQAVAGNTATKYNTALGQQLLLQAMREGNVQYTAELLTLYTRNSTTAAQAMQAQSILRRLSPEGQLLTVQKAVDALNQKYGTEVKLAEQDIADFINAETDSQREAVRQRMLDSAAQAVPGTFRAKYDTLRYLGMLGNPRTHIRNILGNTLFQVPVMAKNRVGAVVEYAANRASGGKVERTKSLTGASPLGKLAAEARADWVNAKGFLDQSGKYSEGQASLSAIEQRADAFSNENIVGRTINRLSDTNSALLEAEDTAAKRFIYSQSLASYLKANGCKSIADADTALLYRARSYAAQEALRNTFNDRNMISDAVSQLGNLSRSDNKAVRAAGYVAEGVLPFKRTPTNIAVRAVEYSPVGAVLGAVDTVRGARAGDMTQVMKGLDRVAAGAAGTALLGAGLLAAGAGYVTGGEDEDDRQQDFNDLTGHQNYALELKDGTSVTLDWLAPEAIPFFIGVELYDAMLDGGLTWGEVTDALKNLSAPMLEMSMLQGLNDTVNNAAYAVNRGDSVVGSLVTSALTNYLTQAIPTLGGQIERTGETERMATYVDKSSPVPTDLQYTLGKVSQKVPGWDYNQYPYIDAWGRTEETGSTAERIFNNFFNPAYVSQVDVDEVEQELQRVKDATGDSNVFPKRADRSITVNGEAVNLGMDTYQKYAKALGQSSYTLVKEGLSLPAYRSMSDEGKAEYIGKLYQYATQTAKAEVSGYEVDTWVKNAKTAQRDIGVSTAEYIALYEKYGSNVLSGQSYEKTKQAVAAGLTVEQWAAAKGGMDADDNGSVSQKEAEAYLNSQDFSRSTKADLWTIINKSWKTNPYA